MSDLLPDVSQLHGIYAKHLDDAIDQRSGDAEGRISRTPAERAALRESRHATHVPERSEEWDRLRDVHGFNPLSYGMEALSRLDNSAGAASQGENNIYDADKIARAAADLAAPNHELGDKYGLPGQFADALSTTANMIPGMEGGQKLLAGAATPLVRGLMKTPEAAERMFGWREQGYADGGKVSKIIRSVANKFGDYQASRMERAADETNLERIHPEGLKSMFNPRDNSLFVSMPPSDFQDYANRIPPNVAASAPYPRAHNVPGVGRVPKDQQTQDWYLDKMRDLLDTKGMYAAPELAIGRTNDDLTNVIQHEGRHRMMAMDRMGDDRSLVQLRANQRPFDWKSMDPEEHTDWLMQKYFPHGSGQLVVPEGYGAFSTSSGKMETQPRLPRPIYSEPYADGGKVIERTVKPAFKALVDRLKKPDGGFTYQPFHEPHEPSGGYAVSPYPERSKILPADKVTAEELWKYQMGNYDLLRDPGHHLGAWHDPESHNVYLDVSKVGPDEQEIAHIGRAANQKAIFDLNNFNSIDVGGTGEPLRVPETYGPGYADGGVVAGGPIKWLSNLVSERLGPAGEAAAAKVRAHAEKTGREASSWGTPDYDPENVGFVKGRQTETSIKGDDAATLIALATQRKPFFIAHPHPVISNMPIASHLNNRNINAKTGAKFMKETGTPGMVYPSPADLSLLGRLGPSFSSLIEGAGSPDVRVLLQQQGDKSDVGGAVNWVNRNIPTRESRDLMQKANNTLGMNEADHSGYAAMINDALSRRFGLDVSMDPAGTASGGVPLQDLLKEYPKAMGYDTADDFLRRPGYREGGDVALKLAKRFLKNPVRESFPGIYKDPDVIASEARRHLVEDPGKEGPMYQLFGHTRESLDDLAQGNRDLDSIQPLLGPRHPVNLSGTAKTSPRVLLPKNAGRLVDMLGEGLKDPELARTRSWYEMSPLWDRMNDLGLGDRGMSNLNNRMAVMSAGSDPRTEINRGFHANWLANEGRLEDFVKYGGVKDEDRGDWFPHDLRDLKGHSYHESAQVPGLLDNETSGRLWPGEGIHKVPTYAAATDPRDPYSARPVADSHFNRILGYPDVATASTKSVRNGVPSLTEYSDIVPWFNKHVADATDLRPRDAQAMLWNLGGPQTGVRYIGPSKLEMISDYMKDTADKLGIHPEEARDLLLQGRIGGAGSWQPPFAKGGRVDGDLDLHRVSQFYARGGNVVPLKSRIDDDLDLHHLSQF
jgi:hypothetical protein